MLALQRSAGNRAVSGLVRSLARNPVVKGGVETKIVSPAVMDLLDAKGVKYAREVTFELIDANGEALVAGRFDVVFRTPITQELIFPELKGDTLSALTANQEIYHPLFKQPGGARVRITSRVGGSLHLPTGAVEAVGPDNFMIVSTENFNEFTAFVEEAATGVRPTHFYFDRGKLRAFNSEAELHAALAEKGVVTTRTPPPKPSAPATKEPLKRPVPADKLPPNPLYDPPSKSPPRPSRADPTAGPPAGPLRKGPNLKPQPAGDLAPKPWSGDIPPKVPVPTPSEAIHAGPTLAPDAVADDFVPKLAATHEAQVLKPGRYIRIGGALYAAIWIGGALFFITDVIAKGPIEAGKEWGLMAILTSKLGEAAGGAVAGAVGFVLFLPGDQAGAGDEQAARERADLVDSIIHDLYPEVVGPRRGMCIGDCTPADRHIFDPDYYTMLHARIFAAVANAWQIEDDDTARRRHRTEAVAQEHRREAEHDLAERANLEKELAGYRAATQPLGFYVGASVGEGGANHPDDVGRTAKRLHELGFLDQPTDDVDALGDSISVYQSVVLHLRRPDGRIDPRGSTEAALRAGRKVSMALP